MIPNILFLFPDQWRGDWWSKGRAHLPVRTPNLEKIARDGVTFQQAYSPSPLCAPARACLATGKNYPADGIANNSKDLSPDVNTIYKSLRDSGYHVMGCGKFDLHKASYSWGEDGSYLLSDWGFSKGIDNEGKIDGVEAFKQGTPGPYLSYLKSKGLAELHVQDFDQRIPFGTFATPLDSDHYCDNWIAQNALSLLSEAPPNKPWFLQVNFAGPHDPFDVTHEMKLLYQDAELGIPFGSYDSKLNHKEIRQNYAAMIENIDRNIGQIFQHPRIKDDLENTFIIFASDHGELLGDHGYFGKCTPYNGSLHVPLIMRGPGVKTGLDYHKPVSIGDLTATFAEIAGISGHKYADSLSLLRELRGEPGQDRIVQSNLFVPNKPEYQWRSVIKDHFKCILWDTGELALFQLEDYEEKVNLAPIHQDLVTELKKYLPSRMSKERTS